MNIDNLTTDEVISLFDKCSKRLGYYHLALLSIDDVRERLEDSRDNETDPIPTDDQIAKACAYVCRKWGGEDWFYAVEKAYEISLKIEKEERVKA